MGILKTVQRSKLYSEFDEEERKKFSITEKKYISHIDTFYYSVFLENDYIGNVSSEIIDMLELLSECKNKLNEEGEEFWFDYDSKLLYSKKRYKLYEHCLSISGMWDIFIATNLPNEVTPRIHVQLRSESLWCLGEKYAIERSFECLKKFLSEFNINILKVQENRIDYCYHTNIIQNAETYFSDDNLKNHLDSTMQIYNKVGRRGKGYLTVEYLSLGNRSSNNVFFRSYNKTREVCEMGYKSFFLDIWRAEGLISEYDYCIYSECYKRKRYDSIELAMMQYYIDFGKDNFLKTKFTSMMNDDNCSVESKRLALKGVVPYPTLIMNIEYQTMRKFYYYADDLINGLPLLSDIKDDNLVRLFQIIDNRKIYLKYLTGVTVSFKRDLKLKEKGKTEKEIYMDFWYRLRSCKVDGIKDTEYIRKYNKNLNIELLQKRLRSNLASLSLYMGNDNTSIDEDMSCLISILNDNSQIYDDNGMIIDIDYNKLKEKKKKALNNILNKHKNLRPSENDN